MTGLFIMLSALLVLIQPINAVIPTLVPISPGSIETGIQFTSPPNGMSADLSVFVNYTGISKRINLHCIAITEHGSGSTFLQHSLNGRVSHYNFDTQFTGEPDTWYELQCTVWDNWIGDTASVWWQSLVPKRD